MDDMDSDFSDLDWEQRFKENEEFERKHPGHPTVIKGRKGREEGERESWRDKAGRIVAALGSLVFWSPIPRKIGEIIPRGVGTPGCAERSTDQPFVVIGKATREHWIRQGDFVGGCAPVPSSRDRYFYFVQTD